jgi:MFS family permease
MLSRHYLLTAGGYILGALCWSLEYPALVSVLLRQVPTRFGAAMAVSGVLSSLGIALAMAGMGRLTAQVGGNRMWQVMLVPAGIFLLVGLGGLAWLWRYDARRASPSGSAELSAKTDYANVIIEGASDVKTTCQ